MYTHAFCPARPILLSSLARKRELVLEFLLSMLTAQFQVYIALGPKLGDTEGEKNTQEI